MALHASIQTLSGGGQHEEVRRGPCSYAYRKVGDWGRAVLDYERALAGGNSGPVQLHTNRAFCLAKMGRYPEALESYGLVLRADPTNVYALHNRCSPQLIYKRMYLKMTKFPVGLQLIRQQVANALQGRKARNFHYLFPDMLML